MPRPVNSEDIFAGRVWHVKQAIGIEGFRTGFTQSRRFMIYHVYYMIDDWLIENAHMMWTLNVDLRAAV